MSLKCRFFGHQFMDGTPKGSSILISRCVRCGHRVTALLHPDAISIRVLENGDLEISSAQPV